MGEHAPTVLVIEDDDGDALLVEELLIDSGETFVLHRGTSLAAAGPWVGEADCALVDLGLPDAHGLGALLALRADAPELAIVVLTGLMDKARGVEAMAAGAQDYIIKSTVDGPGLARAIRYAIERRRTEQDTRRLALSARREDENALLAKGLLPVLDVQGAVSVATRYRPGADALLGGDFFDALVLPDGSVRAIIGDVCGHGPAEAAVGVALRIVWRTMTVAGALPDRTLAIMEQILLRERDANEPFVTVCDIVLDPSGPDVTIRCHGHPAPLLTGPEVRWLDAPDHRGPPLGCLPYPVPADPYTVDLPPGWGLLLMTDGIYEGRVGDGRLGIEGLAEIVAGHLAAGTGAPMLLDSVIDDVQDLHGGNLDDDLALLWLMATDARRHRGRGGSEPSPAGARHVHRRGVGGRVGHRCRRR